MNGNHYVIFIPGLGDDTKKMIIGTNHWRKYGLEPFVYSLGWRDGENDFQKKLLKLLNAVDKMVNEGNKVSLVGTSAGGSAVMNVFSERKDRVHKVINVCGRLRTGTVRGFRSYKSKTASSPSFAQSIKLFESREQLLSKQDRKKVMTVRALLGDELVPSNTTTLDGAYNITVPAGEHMFSIALALTVFSSSLIKFIKS